MGEGELQVLLPCEHGYVLTHPVESWEGGNKVRETSHGLICINQRGAILKMDKAIKMPRTGFVITVEDIIEAALDPDNIRVAVPRR